MHRGSPASVPPPWLTTMPQQVGLLGTRGVSHIPRVPSPSKHPLNDLPRLVPP